MPQLIRWNPDYQVEVDEEVEHYQYISVAVTKLKQGDIRKPASDQFTKVKQILREVFMDHYSLAVKHIYESKLDEGECYIHLKSKDWIIVRYFSGNEKQRFKIEIDFRDSVEDLWMRVNTEHGHKNRPDSRKNGTPITLEQFQQFLHLTTQFLYDSDSFLVLLDDYIKNMHFLAKGEREIQGLLMSSEKSFETILEQLILRKEQLEKRLIENDNDSTLDRAKLRGELEGLLYACTVIRKFR